MNTAEARAAMLDAIRVIETIKQLRAYEYMAFLNGSECRDRAALHRQLAPLEDATLAALRRLTQE